MVRGKNIKLLTARLFNIARRVNTTSHLYRTDIARSDIANISLFRYRHDIVEQHPL